MLGSIIYLCCGAWSELAGSGTSEEPRALITSHLEALELQQMQFLIFDIQLYLSKYTAPALLVEESLNLNVLCSISLNVTPRAGRPRSADVWI